MVNGAARKAVTLEDILAEMQNRFQLIESDMRSRRGFQSTETKPLGTSSGTSSAGIAGFLKNSGDAIDGPLALSPQIANITDGVIDISKDLGLAYTSFILLNPQTIDDTLDTIKGVSFPGQIVVFHINGSTITFSDVDNIQGKDIKVVAGDTISFIFDSIGLGKWRLWTAGAGTTSGYDLIQNDGTPLTQRSTINFTGTGVTAIDNPSSDRTDISVQGVEIFKWSAPHDANKFTLNNLRALEIVDINGVTRGLISGSTNSRVDFALTSGHKLRFFDNITELLEISNTGIVMGSGRIINMNKEKITALESIEFDASQVFTPISTNTIGFDNSNLAIKYNTSSISNFHRFQAGGEFLASISRIGPNKGVITAAGIRGLETIEATQKLFLSTFNNTSPQNGHFWRDISTGLFKIHENGTTKILAVGGNFLPLTGGTMDGNINMADNSLIDCDDISIHGNSRILANSATEFGIQVDGDAAVVGTRGMLAIPFDDLPEGLPTKLTLDTAYGTHKAAMGFDQSNLGSSRIFVRHNDGDWSFFVADGKIIV